jgi:hypothetical protein
MEGRRYYQSCEECSLEDERKEVRRMLGKRQTTDSVDIACIADGWTLVPSNATEEEQEQATINYLCGGKPTWYPPGYIEEPVITEGKLKEKR